MTQPLALVLYEQLLPGTQLVNRLQDLKYRVQVIADPASLMSAALRERPMLVIVDLVSSDADLADAIARLRSTEETKHIPVIAFAPEDLSDLHTTARNAGATIVASEVAILSHLPQFLEQALQVE